MISLPVCRWRKPHVPGQYVCLSPKYPRPPNLVPESFCAECRFADHEVPPPLPQSLPCVHLGGLVPGAVSPGESAGGLYVCALHGRCTVADPDHGGSREDRSCASCADYLPRDPFGPNSTQMLRQAEDFLTAIPAYPTGRYGGRGVIIAAGGDRFFASLYVTVRALRHVGCRLPIQVWFLGRYNEMPAKRKGLLEPYQVEFVDADKVRRRHPAQRLDGWELKVFATLHSSFEELLSLDADCYPCRNPEFLFERDDYRQRGAIFWPDSVNVDMRLKWSAYGVPDPRRLGSIESGQFVLNKALCWQPLNLAWFYNNHSDYYFRYCHGDKHTFEVAWHRCGRPYVMWAPMSPWVDVAYLHMGPDLLPLFVHRCRDKFRLESHTYTTPQTHSLPAFYPSLPLERECWEWMSALARLTGRRLSSYGSGKILRTSKIPKPAPFAIATLFTPEIADLGQATSRVMWDYARRHGYQAIIAMNRIDASRPAAWSKLLLIERYFLENPDCVWLMWIDADAVITNPKQRLEDLIDDDVDFLVAEDVPPRPINTGVFLVRNCPAALDMLRRAYAKRQYVQHPMWEQPAVTEALRECAATLRTRVVSRRLFNSFAFTGEYEKGDFIIHFAGLSPAVKLAGARQAIAWAASPVQLSEAPPPLPVPGKVYDLLPRGPRSTGNGRRSLSKRPWTDLPPIFCITWQQTPERTARATRHFRARRLKVQLFPGIHGQSFGLLAALLSPYPMLGGHVGVLLSHYMLWQTLAYLPHEEILILEDNARVAPSFRKDFRRAYADLPDDWQIAFVGAVAMKGKPVEPITERVSVTRYPVGLHAYLVKRAALPFLLQTNQQARAPLNIQLIENSLPAMKCYTFVPSLVKQRGPRTPVEGTGPR